MGKEPNCETGLCRCCGAMTQCRILNEKYEIRGRTEVYSEMVRDCFGIELCHLGSKPTERLVCNQCINKLRQALSFKIQIMQSEGGFLQHRMFGSKSSAETNVLGAQRPMRTDKIELSDLDESNVYVDASSDGFDDEIDADELSEYGSLEPYNEELRPFQGKSKEKHYADTGQNDYGNGSQDGFSSDDDFGSVSLNTPAHRKNSSKRSETAVSTKNKIHAHFGTAFTDPFMQASNITSIVKYSYACPFKNRFSHILCYYCDQYFLDPLLLREHSMTHNPKMDFKAARNRYTKLDLTRIDCRLCPIKINDLEDFKRHLVTAHGKNYFRKSKDCILPFKLVENVHKCILCDEVFPYFYALYKHMNLHFSNFMCETCGMGFMDELSLQKHIPSHDSKRYPCDTCGNTFKSEYTLNCHIRRIHEKEVDGSFCSKCDAFVLAAEKTKHMVEMHGAPPTVPCAGCDQVFNSRRLLTIHVRRVHMKDYRYECQICHVRFFRRSSLTFHMPRHTGARDHECTVCHKRYPRRKTLLEHMKIHNNVRRYRCQICGQAFVQNCSLKGHMKSKHPE